MKMYCIFLLTGTGKGKKNTGDSCLGKYECGSVEFFLNGRSLGMKTMPRNRHLEWECTV